MPMSTEEARKLANEVYSKYPEVVVLMREQLKAAESLDYRRIMWLNLLLALAAIPHNFHPNHLRLIYRLVRGSRAERKAVIEGMMEAATESILVPVTAP